MMVQAETDCLVAVCHVLTLHALQRLGRWILRQDRPRTLSWRGRPLHEAYLRWPTDDAVISKALRGAWDIIPDMLAEFEDLACLDEELLMNTLDSYVHDLVVARERHTVGQLRARVDSVFPPL